jgi:hypothetical protein
LRIDGAARAIAPYRQPDQKQRRDARQAGRGGGKRRAHLPGASRIGRQRRRGECDRIGRPADVERKARARRQRPGDRGAKLPRCRGGFDPVAGAAKPPDGIGLRVEDGHALGHADLDACGGDREIPVRPDGGPQQAVLVEADIEMPGGAVDDPIGLLGRDRQQPVRRADAQPGHSAVLRQQMRRVRAIALHGKDGEPGLHGLAGRAAPAQRKVAIDAVPDRVGFGADADRFAHFQRAVGQHREHRVMAEDFFLGGQAAGQGTEQDNDQQPQRPAGPCHARAQVPARGIISRHRHQPPPPPPPPPENPLLLRWAGAFAAPTPAVANRPLP